MQLLCLTLFSVIYVVSEVVSGVVIYVVSEFSIWPNKFGLKKTISWKKKKKKNESTW